MKQIKKYLILQAALLIYAIGSVPSKLASSESFLSFKFCLYYGLLILSLVIYAILWQQVLKKFPLNIAYANKASTILWSMLVGLLLFNEGITVFNIIGSLIVIVGIVIMIKGEQDHE